MKRGGSSSAAGPSTRPNATVTKKTYKRAKIDEASDDSEEEGISGVVLERQIDMKSQRRFRKGELIWFRVKTLHPPGEEAGSDAPARKGALPSISHWPGLVAHIVARTRALPNAKASAASAGSIAALAGKSQQKSFTWYEYHLRPLGTFSQTDEVVKPSEDMLPWALGSELLGGGVGWKLLGDEGTRVVKEGARREAVNATAIEDGWKRRWARRIRFSEMLGSWDFRVFRLGMALKAAQVSDDILISFMSGNCRSLDPNG